MAALQQPHAAIVDGGVIKGEPATDDGVFFARAEVVVVLKPLDFTAGAGCLVESLAQRQTDVRTNNRLGNIEDALIPDEAIEKGMLQVRGANLMDLRFVSGVILTLVGEGEAVVTLHPFQAVDVSPRAFGNFLGAEQVDGCQVPIFPKARQALFDILQVFHLRVPFLSECRFSDMQDSRDIGIKLNADPPPTTRTLPRLSVPARRHHRRAIDNRSGTGSANDPRAAA